MDKPLGSARAPARGPSYDRGDHLEVLISAEQIRTRRAEIAREITEQHTGRELTMICILKGSLPFFVDLAREIELPVRFEHLGVSSYGGARESSGELTLTNELSASVRDRAVLVVEDIVDTGRTLRYVLDRIRADQPASLQVAALLDKPSRRVVKVPPIDWVGFEIPDRFVVGYGLDDDGRYRTLPHVAVIDPD